jgi:6,7-dimethyl-8-ribityllumazine synthase
MGTAASSGETLSARGLRCAIVAAQYNETIVAQLLDGARAAWQELGGEAAALHVERVPGAFELPLAARRFALNGAVDAVVALGCVIRGDTAHFDYVAGECARGLMQVTLECSVPVSFGVLTVDTLAQAEERAAPGRLNKGGESIVTAVAMARLLRRI